MINDNNNNSAKKDSNCNLKSTNIKYLLFFTTIFTVLEIIYFIFLYISNTLYIASIVLNIIKYICIFVLIISILYIIPYEHIRTSLDILEYFRIEKNLVLISMVSSISVVVISFFSNIILKLILIISPQCPFLKFCESQITNNTDYETDYYNYFCNYKPNKNSNYFDINSCIEINNYNISDSLKNCKNIYKCELVTTELKEINKSELETLVFFFGIVLVILWLIIMVLLMINFRNFLKITLKEIYKTPGKYEFNIIKSNDNYTYSLCEHNKIKNNFNFDYDNMTIVMCDQHGGNNNKDFINRSNNNNTDPINNNIDIYSSTNRMRS